MKKNLINYKTSIPAVLGLVAVGLYWSNVITQEQFMTGIALLTTVGLIGAKDA